MYSVVGKIHTEASLSHDLGGCLLLCSHGFVSGGKLDKPVSLTGFRLEATDDEAAEDFTKGDKEVREISAGVGGREVTDKEERIGMTKARGEFVRVDAC